MCGLLTDILVKVIEGRFETENIGINKVKLKFFHSEYPRISNI